MSEQVIFSCEKHGVVGINNNWCPACSLYVKGIYARYVPASELAALRTSLADLVEALNTIRYRYFPLDDEARVEWARQTFEIALAALAAADHLTKGENE